MKINILSASLSLVAISPSLACLHTYGQVLTDIKRSYYKLLWAGATDNGLDVCDIEWGWRIDQDGHFSITCLAAYVYAFTKDGETAWYSNGVNGYRFVQVPNYVLNTDRQYEWQTYNFGPC